MRKGTRYRNQLEARLPTEPGKRCKCGALLLRGAECLSCALKDPVRKAEMEKAEAVYEFFLSRRPQCAAR
jgi:hypothetical protein